MRQLLEDLHKLLDEQSMLYKTLITVLKSEQNVVRNFSIEDLYKNNKEKEVLILQIKFLDESCEKLYDRICRDMSLNIDPPCLSELIEKLNEPYRAKLEYAHTKLSRLAQNAKEINSGNENIIQGSLRAIKNSLSFLMSFAGESETTYKNSGTFQPQTITPSFLSEEA